ncbi:MAG TPA: GGDEF domain-containing protein [Burkholderiaceae bacterium]|nr:GGDEF domain-containing protein [Burkholderiaceae bacterium]
MSFMLADSLETPGQAVNSLAGMVLSTQLELLNSFLPMACWLVALLGRDQVEIVSSIGEQVALADRLISCLGEWPGSGSDTGLVRRRVKSAELATLVATGYAGRMPTHAFRAPLRGVRGQLSGMVLGCSCEEADVLRATGPAREIELCLRAISRTLNLYTALTATEKLVYEARQRAQIDPLTKVLNRAGWNRQLRNLAATGVEVAIGLLDLDYLKFTNDTRGHQAGDALLQSTGRAIKSVLRANDSVARLGGDEFAVLLFDVTPDVMHDLRERLQRALADTDVAASIGMALRSESGSLANAMQLADIRMYQEKRGKQRIRMASVDACDFE